MFWSRSWNPDGLHCYVTGGSTGLGLELALLLVQKGAHVSIVARNQERLTAALAQLEAARISPHQKLHAYSFSLYTAAESSAALEAACKEHGDKSPDAVFTCAGAARPKYFVEMTEEDLRHGMDDAYWVQAWTIFVVSFLYPRSSGYMSFLGWGSYAPGKHALRGLADTLQSELMLYPDIKVQIYFPATMLTPGFDEENKTKPKITLEEDNPKDAVTPAAAALALFRGVQAGHTHITGSFIASLFRASTRGVTPKHNWIVDAVLDGIAYFVAPIWRSDLDRRVRATREEHRTYLQERGFFE
ncbi:oxidoreductase [Roridomyces roridus]|uniref:Oxidoreductase n=1 Tax=Roridomyces roridus TaxID=1738132 RepID=A0AAD7FSG2_9AGAR|nr:oxidoreductase [Roridomyces roridus]